MKRPDSKNYVGNPMKYFNDLAKYQRSLPKAQVGLPPEYVETTIRNGNKVTPKNNSEFNEASFEKNYMDPQARKMQRLADKEERIKMRNKIAEQRANLAGKRSRKRRYRQENQPDIVNRFMFGFPTRRRFY